MCAFNRSFALVFLFCLAVMTVWAGCADDDGANMSERDDDTPYLDDDLDGDDDGDDDSDDDDSDDDDTGDDDTTEVCDWDTYKPLIEAGRDALGDFDPDTAYDQFADALDVCPDCSVDTFVQIFFLISPESGNMKRNHPFGSV